MALFRAWINPLKCFDIDELVPGERPDDPPPERILDYLFAPEMEKGCAAFVARYREIAAVPDPLFVAPAEQSILDKLVWPLRHAKGSYALGNYLGCIALCGMVGEMVAILLWDISKVALQQKPLDQTAQRALLGSTFERLGQERRTQVLHVLGLIDDDAKAAFDDIREIRRRYLHLFYQPHGQLATDAARGYKSALQVVAVVLGQSFKDGAVALRPDLMTYLVARGVVELKEAGGA